MTDPGEVLDKLEEIIRRIEDLESTEGIPESEARPIIDAAREIIEKLKS